MVKEKPIYCPNCNIKVSTEENEMFLVRQNDLKCPNCGTVVLRINKVIY